MSEFSLEIKTDGAAFTENDDPCPEVSRILRLVADKVEGGWPGGRILDINGNDVGYFLWRLQESDLPPDKAGNWFDHVEQGGE